MTKTALNIAFLPFLLAGCQTSDDGARVEAYGTLTASTAIVDTISVSWAKKNGPGSGAKCIVLQDTGGNGVSGTTCPEVISRVAISDSDTAIYFPLHHVNYAWVIPAEVPAASDVELRYYSDGAWKTYTPERTKNFDGAIHRAGPFCSGYAKSSSSCGSQMPADSITLADTVRFPGYRYLYTNRWYRFQAPSLQIEFQVIVK